MDNFIEWRIIVKKLEGELSEEENLMFEQWLMADATHFNFFKKVEADWFSSEFQADELNVDDLIRDFDDFVKRQKSFRTKRKIVWIQPYLRYAAVISFLLVAAVIIWSASRFAFVKDGFIRVNDEVALSELYDLDLACLVLPDGRHILLDTMSDGLHVVDNNLNIRKRGQTLNYLPQNPNPSKQRHGLYIPQGKSYQIKLAEGSTIWVNSETYITYPAGFSKESRLCHLDGEAFFDVVASPITFLVHTERANVEVMGTSFNVCSYSSDNEFMASLVKGTVKVNAGDQQLVLKPHQEAILSDKDAKLRLRSFSPSAESWFSETIFFENEPLSRLVRRLSHLYGAKFSFSDEQLRNLHFTGYFEKADGLNNLLDVIAMTSDVRFVPKKQGNSLHYLIQKTDNNR